MAFRPFKQFIIALVFLSILSGFGFLIYYLVRPAPSCFDGIQNQEEEEIDCGGPCISCEYKRLKEIEILWTEALPSQENFYDLVAQIRNPNQNFGADNIPYQFELYDVSDNLLSQYSGSTFILPGQTKYLIRMKVASSGQVNKVSFSFGKVEWQKLESYQLPQLIIQGKEYRLLGSEEVGFSQVRGVLVNKSNFDFEKVGIDILLFDSSRRLLAVNVTEVGAFLSSQRRDFVTTWFREITGSVALVETEAETNILDPDNYLTTRGEELEKFQEY